MIIVQYSHRVWSIHEVSDVNQKCLNQRHSKVGIRIHLSDNFPIKNVLKQDDDILLLLLNFQPQDDWDHILMVQPYVLLSAQHH
jgi:hypothetical protein